MPQPYTAVGLIPTVWGIRKRSEMIGYAIDARRQRFPGERPYVYQPHAKSGESFRWDAAAKEATRGYNRNDLII